jgi:hypothetical protein
MHKEKEFKVGYVDDGFRVTVTVYCKAPDNDSRHATIVDEPTDVVGEFVSRNMAAALNYLVDMLKVTAGTRYDATWVTHRLADFCDFVQANPLELRRGFTIDRRDIEDTELPAIEDSAPAG